MDHSTIDDNAFPEIEETHGAQFDVVDEDSESRNSLQNEGIQEDEPKPVFQVRLDTIALNLSFDLENDLEFVVDMDNDITIGMPETCFKRHETFMMSMKSLESKQYKCLVMENELIRVTVVPALGGRVLSLFDKKAEIELLHNPQTQSPVLVKGKPFLPGGIQVNITNYGVEPGVSNPSCFLPVSFEYGKVGESMCFVCVGDLDARTGVKWRCKYSIKPGESILYQEFTCDMDNCRKKLCNVDFLAFVHSEGLEELVLPVKTELSQETQSDRISRVEWCNSYYKEKLNASSRHEECGFLPPIHSSMKKGKKKCDVGVEASPFCTHNATGLYFNDEYGVILATEAKSKVGMRKCVVRADDPASHMKQHYSCFNTRMNLDTRHRRVKLFYVVGNVANDEVKETITKVTHQGVGSHEKTDIHNYELFRFIDTYLFRHCAYKRAWKPFLENPELAQLPDNLPPPPCFAKEFDELDHGNLFQDDPTKQTVFKLKLAQLQMHEGRTSPFPLLNNVDLDICSTDMLRTLAKMFVLQGDNDQAIFIYRACLAKQNGDVKNGKTYIEHHARFELEALLQQTDARNALLNLRECKTSFLLFLRRAALELELGRPEKAIECIRSKLWPFEFGNVSKRNLFLKAKTINSSLNNAPTFFPRHHLNPPPAFDKHVTDFLFDTDALLF